MNELFYKNPRVLVLSLFVILVAGLSSFLLLPRLEDPEIKQRWALILAPYPGASPERVEALVTDPIEDEVLELAEVKDIFSNSRRDIAVMRVIVRDDVSDPSQVFRRIRDKLSDAQGRLPLEAGRPELVTEGLRAYTMIAALRWRSSDEPSLGLLGRLAEDLRLRLARMPGTQFSSLSGAPAEELQVLAESARLSALGLDAPNLAERIRRHDAKVASGQLEGLSASARLEVAGEFDSVERLRRLPIAMGADGQSLLLGDIAEIKRGLTDPPESLALIDGQPGVAIAARMQADQRVDLWAAAAREQLAEFEKTLPESIELQLIFDQSRYTEQRLSELIGNLALGAALVILVGFVMMGWRAALLVGVSLPLSSLMVLAGMRLLDVPMHQMSITGLIIALGLLIDNAIVIVDEVRAHMRRGDSPSKAISESVDLLARPLFGSTLTTVLAFAPLILMPGSAGEFVGSIGVTVVLALLSSLILSLTVIPALTGLFAEASPRAGFWAQGLSAPRLSRLADASLRWALAHPGLTIALSLLAPVLGFYGKTQLREQFFPPADRDQLQLTLRLPPQSTIYETRARALAVDAMLRRHAEVATVHWFLGGEAPMFYYNLVPGQNGSPFYARAMVQLRSPFGNRELVREIQAELDAEHPESQGLVLQLEQGPPFEAPVEIRLRGPDLDSLDAFGEELRALLSTIPDVVQARCTLVDSSPKLQFRLDEERARQLGFDPLAIALSLEASTRGLPAGSIIEDSERLPLRLRLVDESRVSLAGIESLEVLTAPRRPGDTRARVPLSALGHWELQPERANIFRHMGRRANFAQAWIRAGVLPATVLRQVQEKLADQSLPDSYQVSFGGEAAERDSAVGNLMASVSLLLVLMVATLVLSFGSFRLAGIIGAVGLFSIGLGLLPLWIAGYPFGFMAIVGTMGLVGVAINDSIVVLAALEDDREARTGDREAIVRVVSHSTRHVLTTTLTTVFGFIPLLYQGGGFWPPLALAVAGGVAASTVLALTFVPAVYALLRRPCCEVNRARGSQDGRELRPSARAETSAAMSASSL